MIQSLNKDPCHDPTLGFAPQFRTKVASVRFLKERELVTMARYMSTLF